MRVLIAGGAGYVGSHMTRLLLDEGHEVFVLDNLSNGQRDTVPERVLVKGDLRHRPLLDTLLSGRSFDAVMHFASCARGSDPAAHPERCYWNNVGHTLNLLDAMVKRRIRRIVYSSTAAIYGEARYLPVDEAHAKDPANAGGRSQWMLEQILGEYEKAHGLRHACLRHFNVAGAHPSGALGDRRHTRLIPRLLQAASGRGPAVKIFGSDYPTPDGTCVRDYVHVADLCRAHLLALQRLMDGGRSRTWNIGTGRGHSVREVIECVSRVTGCPVPVTAAARRAGDATEVVADATLARRELGWQPRHPDLRTIVEHAWRWECRKAAPPLRAAG